MGERFALNDEGRLEYYLGVEDLNLKDYPDAVDQVVQHRYREFIGSLVYLNQWTRPDLGFAVTSLSRYLHEPEQKYWAQARNVLRYLKGVKGHWILVSIIPEM